MRRFLEFAHERGWRVAVLGVSEECLDLYRLLGLRALYHGDEAVVDTAAFSLEGVRSARCGSRCIAFSAPGIVVRVVLSCELDAALRAQLEEIARTWRGTAPERGWVMAMDTLFRPATTTPCS